MKTKRIARGYYHIDYNGRTYSIYNSPQGWKIYETHEASFYNGGDWWETTNTLRDAKQWIRDNARRAA